MVGYSVEQFEAKAAVEQDRNPDPMVTLMLEAAARLMRRVGVGVLLVNQADVTLPEREEAEAADLVSVAEASRQTGVPIPRLHRAIHRGEVRSYKVVGRKCRRVRVSEVRAWAASVTRVNNQREEKR